MFRQTLSTMVLFSSLLFSYQAHADDFSCVEIYKTIASRPYAAFCQKKASKVFMYFAYAAKKPAWCAKAISSEKKVTRLSKSMQERTGRRYFAQLIHTFSTKSPVIQVKLPIRPKQYTYVKMKEVDNRARFQNLHAVQMDLDNTAKYKLDVLLRKAMYSSNCKNMIRTYL